MTIRPIEVHVLIFIIAWFIADLLTPVIIKLSQFMGAFDRPHSYKIHKEPIPFLGGITILIAFTVAIFAILRFEDFKAYRHIFAILFGGFLVAVIGCIDDFRPIRAIVKLIIIVVVTFVISHYDVIITLTPFYLVNFILTALWIAGITSAINSLDNMDGAATGIAGIICFWTFYIAWYTPPWGQRATTYIAIALLGAILGFLRYNFKPAKIFLGDNGSFLLGFLLASLMVLTGWAKGDKLKAIIIPCCILVVPLYDITLSTILRLKNRIVKGVAEAIAYCGRDHITHRLCALGLTQIQTVILLYFLGAMGGAIGAFIFHDWVTKQIYLPIVAGSIIVLIVFGAILDRAKVYPNKD